MLPDPDHREGHSNNCQSGAELGPPRTGLRPRGEKARAPRTASPCFNKYVSHEFEIGPVQCRDLTVTFAEPFGFEDDVAHAVQRPLPLES